MELNQIESIKDSSYCTFDVDGSIRRLLIEEIIHLRSIIVDTVMILDSKCSDKDAYIDGRCSLSDAVDVRIMIERGV